MACPKKIETRLWFFCFFSISLIIHASHYAVRNEEWIIGVDEAHCSPRVWTYLASTSMNISFTCTPTVFRSHVTKWMPVAEWNDQRPNIGHHQWMHQSSSNKLSMTFRLPSSSSSTLFQHLPISIHYNTTFGFRQQEWLVQSTLPWIWPMIIHSKRIPRQQV
jgi:hypothetical protein